MPLWDFKAYSKNLESPLWFTFWFSLIFKELWLVNVFFWLIHQSLISWFYYLIEYSGVWSVINHVATYQYWETLRLRFNLFHELIPNCEKLMSAQFWCRSLFSIDVSLKNSTTLTNGGTSLPIPGLMIIQNIPWLLKPKTRMCERIFGRERLSQN